MLIYQIAITLIPGIGDVLGKKLVTHFGSAEAVFREPKAALKKIRGIGEVLSASVGNRKIFEQAEKEMKFVEKYRITPLFFQDSGYPERLKQCIDGPVLIFYKGNAGLNPPKVIGIVGTRKATFYGRSICRNLVEGLTDLSPLVISGLAYGIDGTTHRTALDLGLPTVGVLGHGLDRIYPSGHKELAQKMIRDGGLLTEFLPGTKPDRENFPRRNRIIAGLCDAIVVVEARHTGGALITATIANSYNRDVFAVPGRIGDKCSEGTNFLIRTNQAHLVQKAEDIKYIMGWAKETGKQPEQRRIFMEMTMEEERIIACLQQQEMGIDDLMMKTELTFPRMSTALLNLEFEGVIRILPGRIYGMA